MTDFTIKQGDLEPLLAVTLATSTGPADLSTATSVRFRLARLGLDCVRTEVFDRLAIVDNAPTGDISYPWQATDTDVPGMYSAEFVVEWPSARPQTFPPDGYLSIEIIPKL